MNKGRQPAPQLSRAHHGVEVLPALAQPRALLEMLAGRRGADSVSEVLSPRATIRGWFLPPLQDGLRGIRAVVGERVFVARRKHLRPDVLARHPQHPIALHSGFLVELQLNYGWNRCELQFKDEARRWHTFHRSDLRLSWLWPMKRVLGRLATSGSHETWMRTHGEPDEMELAAMAAFLPHFTRRPLLSILMPVYNPPEKWLRRAIESVRAQNYPEWQLCIADDCSPDPRVREMLEHFARLDPRIHLRLLPRNGHICEASNAALELCEGEFTVLLDHDDELPPHALYHVAWEAANHPECNVIFSDEDKIDEHGLRRDPYFKPRWNQELLLGQNCVSHLGAFRTARLREIGGFRPGLEGSQDWDVTLRALDPALPGGGVRHIPRILYHWRTLGTSTAATMAAKPYARRAGQRAVEDYLQANGTGAQLVPDAEGNWQILWPLPNPAPRVSIIIPSRDQVKLLRKVVDSLFQITQYPGFELIVLDHESVCPHCRAYLEQLPAQRENVRVVPVSGPFNWSAFCNRGAKVASGEVLVFLNNDVEIFEPDWLLELVRQALRPGVGAAGACLLYPDRTIQHAGVVLNLLNVAGHAFRGSPMECGSMGGPPTLVREVTALTGACLAVQRCHFERAGGFDAVHLPVNYNDVDLCLRLRSLGLRNIFTPFSRLIHLESSTRGRDEMSSERKAAATAEAQVLVDRWPAEFIADACWNPNLNLHCEIPQPGIPRLTWPWQPPAEIERFPYVSTTKSAKMM